VPDTGDVDADLRGWVRSIMHTLIDPVSSAVVRALYLNGTENPLAADLRRRFWLTRSALAIPIVERAAIVDSFRAERIRSR